MYICCDHLFIQSRNLEDFFSSSASVQFLCSYYKVVILAEKEKRIRLTVRVMVFKSNRWFNLLTPDISVNQNNPLSAMNSQTRSYIFICL